MHTLIVLFNHTLTAEQKKAAEKELGATRIVLPPENISGLWAAVPPQLGGLSGYLEPVRQWLDEVVEPGDHVLVQGEFGATWLMIRHVMRLRGVPVYSTTMRQAREKHLPDGTVVVQHVFAHVRFREYGK